MVENKSKAILGIGVGAVVAGLLLLARKKPGPPPPPPPPPGFANLYGRVTDAKTGEPIWMVLISLQDILKPWLQPQTGHTTVEGDYIFMNLEPSEYEVTFSKDGYISQTKEITLTEGNNALSIGLTPAAFIGFTLGLRNPPPEAVLWNANFAENSFKYDPMADSGWLEVDAIWDYPTDPKGCTTLRIWALDAHNNILFDIYNLGPVNNGNNYIYDYSTGILTEV